MTKAIVPSMVARNSGHIIMLGSVAGHESYAGGAIYCATKHAVHAYTNALRADLVATQVCCCHERFYSAQNAKFSGWVQSRGDCSGDC
jgi:NADP-dependent 3-hydroxy acid dehydrogenase YdfG